MSTGCSNHTGPRQNLVAKPLCFRRIDAVVLIGDAGKDSDVQSAACSRHPFESES